MSTILVDVDGVVADTISAWLDMYNRDYNDKLKPKDITAWDLSKFVKPECGREIYSYLELTEFYDEVNPVSKALWGVRAIRSLGHRVIFVSAGLFESKVHWLCEAGFPKDFLYADERPSTAKDIILCNDKTLIKGDWLIDDRPENVDEFMEQGGRAVLFAQPWNKSYTGHAKRVYSWEGIVKYFTVGQYE